MGGVGFRVSGLGLEGFRVWASGLSGACKLTKGFRAQAFRISLLGCRGLAFNGYGALVQVGTLDPPACSVLLAPAWWLAL